MVKKSRLSFGEQKFSVRGMFSILLGIISLVAGIVLVIISSKSRGNAGIAVGSCGIVAVITSVLGIVFSVMGACERDKTGTPAYIGFILNIIITIAWGCLFAIGL